MSRAPARLVEEGGDLLDVRRDGPRGRRHRLPSTGKSIEGDLPTGLTPADMANHMGIALIWIAAILTAITGWDYFRKALPFLRDGTRD